MKATLIQPKYFNIWEALGSAYLAAYAKKHFKGPLEIRTFQGFFDSDQEIIEACKDCDVVGFSCTSPTFRPGVELARAIKAVNPKVHTVFGGFHPSAVPNDCLEEDGVDQVVQGEGESAFVEVLNGDRTPIIRGEIFTGINDIFPDRALIRNERTIDLCEKQIGRRITSFMTNRVCPLRCSFCAERIVTGVHNRATNPVRERDPGHLLDEIQWAAKKYNLNYFKFVDATWNTSPEKAISFCEEKIRRNFSLPWEANIHGAFTTPEMFEAMKAAGCSQINVGCESGSLRILRDIGKGLKVERLIEVFKWAQQAGLERRGFFILGMPNETLEDIRMTEKLVETIEPEVFGITLVCPYPGSDHYDPEVMKDWDWTFTDEYSNPYWSTKYFSNEGLKERQKHLMGKFSKSLSWHNKMTLESKGVSERKK